MIQEQLTDNWTFPEKGKKEHGFPFQILGINRSYFNMSSTSDTAILAKCLASSKSQILTMLPNWAGLEPLTLICLGPRFLRMGKALKQVQFGVELSTNAFENQDG